MKRAIWCVAAAWLCAGLSSADSSVRKPLGVYAKVDIEDAIAAYPGSGSPTAAQLHTYLRSLYDGLLANPAVSGITVAQHWDNIQLTDPAVTNPASASNDWSYLDDAFAEANAAHKSVQLIITPGVDAPAWLFAKLSSCDSLFNKKPSATPDCGYATFKGFPETQRADTNTIPMPWNQQYEQAWFDFLGLLNTRYASNSAFVAISLGGPIAASDEIIFPDDQNTTVAQPSGLSPTATWAALIANAFPNTPADQNTDEPFINAWKQTIDAFEKIFSGITIFISADAGDDLPIFSSTVTPHPDNTLFQKDCSDSINGKKNDEMSCEAKTEILSYFVAETGPNGKSSQVGGMTASSQETPGDIGIAGVKVLTALATTPVFSGGAEYDHPVTGGNLQQTGCPAYPDPCPNLSAEEAAYNVMATLFYGTPVATFYGSPTGSAPIQYLEVPYVDVQYANTTPCPTVPSPILGNLSYQDLLNRASRDLLSMAGQTSTLPPLTCTPNNTPTIGFVANAEGESITIGPNTWVEIKGSDLARAGDSRTWQGSDFANNQLPTSLDGVSVTINGKSAFVYYISPTQINVLTPASLPSKALQVVVSNNGLSSVPYNVDVQPLSPSFFIFGAGPYVIAEHLGGAGGCASGVVVCLVGPSSLIPGTTTPAKPGETIVIYANGFGPTTSPVVNGSVSQSGSLSPLPVIQVGGLQAMVQFAGLVAVGEFQFNVVLPPALPNGDLTITAAYGGLSTQPGTLLTIHN